MSDGVYAFFALAGGLDQIGHRGYGLQDPKDGFQRKLAPAHWTDRVARGVRSHSCAARRRPLPVISRRRRISCRP
jgi:hypothetical protein